MVPRFLHSTINIESGRGGIAPFETEERSSNSALKVVMSQESVKQWVSEKSNIAPWFDVRWVFRLCFSTESIEYIRSIRSVVITVRTWLVCARSYES